MVRRTVTVCILPKRPLLPPVPSPARKRSKKKLGMLLRGTKANEKCKLTSNDKNKSLSQSSNYSSCLFACFFVFLRQMCPPSQFKHSYVHKFFHFQKKSSFAGTVIRTLGVMRNGVGITRRWRSGALVNICKKKEDVRYRFFPRLF